MIALYIALGIIGGIVGLIILYLLFVAICSLFVKNKDYDKPSKFYWALLRGTTAFVLKLIGVKTEVRGKEKIDSIDGKFLLVSNHRSNFDPLCVYTSLKKQNIAMVSKPENFKVFLFGKVARKCCFRAIDRKSPRNAILTIKSCADLLEKDSVSICVYPEGTRSKTGELLPFHDGVFKIAQMAGVPIVVCAISGTEKGKRKCIFKKRKVILDVIEVIDKEKVAKLSSHELSALARQDILTSLGDK